MNGLVDVKAVARFLGCSDRRVRVLLAQGRIFGVKIEDGTWRAFWPLNVRPGRRGPDLRGYPVRKLTKAPGKPARASKGLK